MNINRYALCKERSLQKIISKQPKPNTTAIGVCSETQVTHHIITKRSDECLPMDGTNYSYENESNLICAVSVEGDVTGIEAGDSVVKIQNEYGLETQATVHVTPKTSHITFGFSGN